MNLCRCSSIRSSCITGSSRIRNSIGRDHFSASTSHYAGNCQIANGGTAFLCAHSIHGIFLFCRFLRIAGFRCRFRGFSGSNFRRYRWFGWLFFRIRWFRWLRTFSRLCWLTWIGRFGWLSRCLSTLLFTQIHQIFPVLFYIRCKIPICSVLFPRLYKITIFFSNLNTKIFSIFFSFQEKASFYNTVFFHQIGQWFFLCSISLIGTGSFFKNRCCFQILRQLTITVICFFFKIYLKPVSIRYLKILFRNLLSPDF